jgi:hypothetical protein
MRALDAHLSPRCKPARTSALSLPARYATALTARHPCLRERSRFDGRRWEVNQMHEDYLALKGEARARLRYLLALLAKDLSQHAHRVPGAVEASEDVAAILALAERNLRGA